MIFNKLIQVTKRKIEPENFDSLHLRSCGFERENKADQANIMDTKILLKVKLRAPKIRKKKVQVLVISLLCLSFILLSAKR
jgi:hypothetical protein